MDIERQPCDIMEELRLEKRKARSWMIAFLVVSLLLVTVATTLALTEMGYHIKDGNDIITFEVCAHVESLVGLVSIILLTSTLYH